MRTLFCLLLLVSSAGAETLPASAKPIPRVQAVPLPHHITSFQLDGKELTAIHFDPADFRVFWYPIMTSKGVSLTRMGHPHDPLTHAHHNSVWLSHTNVNQINFWTDYEKETQGRIINVEVSRDGYRDGDDAASMRMVNHWITDSNKEVQLIEVRRSEVRIQDGMNKWWLIIDNEFTAPKNKTTSIGPSFFGMIAVRMAKSIGVRDGGGRILNSEGLVNEREVFRKATRWVDYTGRITNEEDGFAGITLMNHPGNPHHPTAFHVRDDGWMGAALIPDVLENPVRGQPPLAEAAAAIEVSAEKPLRLRYALWVHDGIPSQPEIEEQYERFKEMPLAELHPPKPKK
jgi:hypothetical protein